VSFEDRAPQDVVNPLDRFAYGAQKSFEDECPCVSLATELWDTIISFDKDLLSSLTEVVTTRSNPAIGL
jgi:hypothetical protein